MPPARHRAPRPCLAACYGNWLRYKDVQRIHEVSKDTLLAMNGEMSDYQKVLQILEQKRIAEYCVDDGSTQTTAELHSYLTRMMYQKRCARLASRPGHSSAPRASPTQARSGSQRS